MGVFQDFIPEGQELNALGSGFADFVPEDQKPVPKPEHIVNLEPVKEEKIEKSEKKRG